MNPTEAITLCRYVKAACPQQKFDEYTPLAWADLLDDIRMDDAKAAVKALAKRQPFVSPAEIRAEVKRIRKARVDGATPPIPPAGLTQLEERDWLRDAWARIGNGETIPETRGELRPRPPLAAIGQPIGGAR